MKKAIALFLCIAMIFNFTACKPQGDIAEEHALNSQSDNETKEEALKPPITPKSDTSREFSIFEEPSYEEIHR